MLRLLRVSRLPVFVLLAWMALGDESRATIGVYAMVPVIRDRPYIAERLWRQTMVLNDGTSKVDENHTVMMRDRAGRLHETQVATPPDAKGAFRKAWATILDPVTMQQITLDLEAKTFLISAIPPEVKNTRQLAILDCAAQIAQQKVRGSRGQAATAEFEDLGETMMLGVHAKGCRITRKLQTQEMWSVSEIWASVELQINLMEATRYGNGREDLQQVERLQIDEPDSALFKVPEGYKDMRTPAPRTNMNPNLDLEEESGAIEWHDGMATLTAAGGYPMQQVSETLGKCLGIAVGTERELQVWEGDLFDITAPTWLAAHPQGPHAFSGKPAKVKVDFQINEDRSAEDLEALLKEVARQVNEQVPYSFEVRKVVRKTGTLYAMVPTTTHDESGRLIHPTPFLDTPVTIPAQKAKVMDLGAMVAAQITATTGYHFSCCQSYVAGQLWGSNEIEYQADKRPARDVIADLMEAEGQVPGYMSACQARDRRFCMINVQPHPPVAMSKKPANDVCKIPGWNPR